MTRISKEDLTGLLVEDWFTAHPEYIARRYHALMDAQTSMMASLVTNDRVPAPARTYSYRRAWV